MFIFEKSRGENTSYANMQVFGRKQDRPARELFAPTCAKIDDTAVQVTTADGHTIVNGNADDIIDSLSLRIAMKTRTHEDIKYRSSNFENWYKQKKQYGPMPDMRVGSLSVQGVKVPYYVFTHCGRKLFTVWFNLWPVAWIAGGPNVYEKHDSMKTLYSSIEDRIKNIGGEDCEVDTSDTAIDSVAGGASDILDNAAAAARYDANSADVPQRVPQRVPQLVPQWARPNVLPQVSTTQYTIIRLYDGKRTIFTHSADSMRLIAQVYPEIKCTTFDTVFDLIVRGFVNPNFNELSAVFLSQLKCPIPPGLASIQPARSGANIGAYVANLQNQPVVNDTNMCIVNHYVVSLSRAPVHS